LQRPVARALRSLHLVRSHHWLTQQHSGTNDGYRKGCSYSVWEVTPKFGAIQSCRKQLNPLYLMHNTAKCIDGDCNREVPEFKLVNRFHPEVIEGHHARTAYRF